MFCFLKIRTGFSKKIIANKNFQSFKSLYSIFKKKIMPLASTTFIFLLMTFYEKSKFLHKSLI